MSCENEFLDLSNRRLFGLLMLASRQWRLQSGRSLQDMGLSITHFPYMLCLYWKDGQTQRQRKNDRTHAKAVEHELPHRGQEVRDHE